jgi:integrase
MINNHIIPSIGGITLDKLRPIHIQKYYSQKLVSGRIDGNGGLSARSVHHHHRVLSEALEYAVNMQVLANNPAKSVAPPKPQKKQMNVLTKEQIEILLEGAKKSSSRLYEAIYIAINTGMRRGEIGGLRWKDIDFKNNLISIRQTLIRTKELGLQLREAAKTDGSRRSIAISDSLIHLLKKMKAKQAQERLHLGPLYKDNDLVFAHKDGSPIDIDYYSQAFSKLVKRLDLPHVRFHDLRHTHATLLIQQGIHPKVISERLGHTTIAITMDLYSHVMPNMQKEAVQKLDSLLFGSK